MGACWSRGGEYNYGKFVLSNRGAVYDPIKDEWTEVMPPKGWWSCRYREWGTVGHWLSSARLS